MTQTERIIERNRSPQVIITQSVYTTHGLSSTNRKREFTEITNCCCTTSYCPHLHLDLEDRPLKRFRIVRLPRQKRKFAAISVDTCCTECYETPLKKIKFEEYSVIAKHTGVDPSEESKTSEKSHTCDIIKYTPNIECPTAGDKDAQTPFELDPSPRNTSGSNIETTRSRKDSLIAKKNKAKSSKPKVLKMDKFVHTLVDLEPLLKMTSADEIETVRTLMNLLRARKNIAIPVRSNLSKMVDYLHETINSMCEQESHVPGESSRLVSPIKTTITVRSKHKDVSTITDEQPGHTFTPTTCTRASSHKSLPDYSRTSSYSAETSKTTSFFESSILKPLRTILLKDRKILSIGSRASRLFSMISRSAKLIMQRVLNQ